MMQNLDCSTAASLVRGSHVQPTERISLSYSSTAGLRFSSRISSRCAPAGCQWRYGLRDTLQGRQSEGDIHWDREPCIHINPTPVPQGMHDFLRTGSLVAVVQAANIFNAEEVHQTFSLSDHRGHMAEHDVRRSRRHAAKRRRIAPEPFGFRAEDCDRIEPFHERQLPREPVLSTGSW